LNCAERTERPRFVGKQHKVDASEAKVTCAVSIGPREGGGFGLAIKMHVEAGFQVKP
jgi:hypothetical protein